jgi:hypothetical protein
MEQSLIRDAIEELVCPKGFTCCTEGLEKLCKAKDVGMQTFVLCLEPNPLECPFSKPVAIWYMCECPLRVYIAKEVKK